MRENSILLVLVALLLSGCRTSNSDYRPAPDFIRYELEPFVVMCLKSYNYDSLQKISPRVYATKYHADTVLTIFDLRARDSLRVSTKDTLYTYRQMSLAKYQASKESRFSHIKSPKEILRTDSLYFSYDEGKTDFLKFHLFLATFFERLADK
jgi:hypothetical protein